MTDRMRFLPLLLLFASAMATLQAQTSAGNVTSPTTAAATSAPAGADSTSAPIVEYAPPPAEYALDS